ncbi:hypothetical protein R1flu_003752 [Riccia fluitans]|uniref:Uncharacterized protein n=1 Tax=Riccia fluitans TaxID=41844 RepID=A0ABD1Y9W8_9MARC
MYQSQQIQLCLFLTEMILGPVEVSPFGTESAETSSRSNHVLLLKLLATFVRQEVTADSAFAASDQAVQITMEDFSS